MDFSSPNSQKACAPRGNGTIRHQSLMNIQENSTRASRRSAITWMLTASSTIPFLNEDTPPEEFIADNPKLSIPRKNIWDRTLNKSQLLLVATLTDIIIPGDDEKPNSCDLHIPDFIDEWISAPFALQQKDRLVILAGLKWMNKESRKRFKKGFSKLNETHQVAICNDISNPITAKPIYKSAVAFFLLFQKLTYGAYFTTETGKKELGENPLPTFEFPVEEQPAGPRKLTRVEKRKLSKKPIQDQRPKIKPRAQRSKTGSNK